MMLIALVLAAFYVIATLALSVAQHVRLRRGRMLVGLWVATCAIPLLGLSGTIAGLMTAFDAVSYAAADQRAGMLAEGISEAMSCTAFGLGLFALFLASTIIATVRTRRASPRARRDLTAGSSPASLTPGPSPASGEGSS
jgi:flagellar motor component MotA